MKKEVRNIYNDLDALREFCREEGFRFDEADLYRRRGMWSLMQREKYQGLVIDNQWEKGARIFRRNIHVNKSAIKK